MAAQGGTTAGTVPVWLRRRWAASWDVAAGLLVFAVYLAVAATAAGRFAAADRNADRVAAAQRVLRLPSERAVNAWTAGHRAVATVADYHYAVGYLVTTAAAVLWLRARRPGSYRRHASVLLAVNLVAITGFLVYPVTPPRLLAGGGFVDTVERHGTWGSWGSGLVSQVANQHAAMPSLHVAWAAWVAVTLLVEGAPRWLARSAVLHVGTTTAVIVMTGNHWFLDAVAGVLVVAAVQVPVQWLAAAGRR